MTCIVLGIKIVICAALALILVKLGLDQHKIEWHSKQLPQNMTERCADILLGPEVRLDWPNWQTFADELASEVHKADGEEVGEMCIHICLSRNCDNAGYALHNWQPPLALQTSQRACGQ